LQISFSRGGLGVNQAFGGSTLRPDLCLEGYARVQRNVAEGLLGRTNLAFPRHWLKLVGPLPGGKDVDHQALAAAARAAKVPIDISGNPMFWGSFWRGDANAVLMQVSDTAYENATGASHAADLVQAHLIESLTSIGREWIDFYFIQATRALEEPQLAGAFESLEAARQDGHIRFIGIHCGEQPFAVLANWQFHDAFDVVSVPAQGPGIELILSLAKERRVGVLARSSFQENPLAFDADCILNSVRSPDEVIRACRSDR
jgi:hypothetical protein